MPGEVASGPHYQRQVYGWCWYSCGSQASRQLAICLVPFILLTNSYFACFKEFHVLRTQRHCLQFITAWHGATFLTGISGMRNPNTSLVSGSFPSLRGHFDGHQGWAPPACSSWQEEQGEVSACSCAALPHILSNRGFPFGCPKTLSLLGWHREGKVDLSRCHPIGLRGGKTASGDMRKWYNIAWGSYRTIFSWRKWAALGWLSSSRSDFSTAGILFDCICGIIYCA